MTRAALGADERMNLDAQIMSTCRTGLSWGNIRRAMVFLPIQSRHEIDTWPLVRWVWETCPGVRLYAPQIVDGEIAAVQITPATQFSLSRWNIPEPEVGTLLARHSALDLVLTPLLGFDAQGQRVGFGRGFYDRFFQRQATARRVGLGYESLRCEVGIAAEDHDVPLDEVITEAHHYIFN